MTTSDQEYVIAPWDSDVDETKILTVDLPSRDLVVQLEVPVAVLARTRRLAQRHEMPVEQALGERLERNRAHLAVLTAQAATDVSAVRDQLSTARELLADVETLDTSAVEADIDRLWERELDSR